MRKSLRFLAAACLAALFSLSAHAQSANISGTVRNSTSKEGVPAVSITVKGTSQGTYTDDKGLFSFSTTSKFPLTLVFSSIGFDTREVNVSSASETLSVDLTETSTLGQEVVMAANRTPQRILESPVTVERMSYANVKNIAAPSYYESLTNLKGVDMHTASLTFRTVTTRGFVSSGNTRLNQLVDGMDNQAPGLNFSVSSIVGLTEIDVDNIELLSGASSALYGSGGMNGTLLINGKNPFKYQGLSFNLKQGISHVDSRQRKPAPYYNWSFRWAKAFKDKFAFKLNAELLKGSDWQAEDYRNKQQTGILSYVIPGNRFSDPNYNGINVYGDETSFNMNGFSFAVQDQINRGVLGATGNQVNLVALQNAYYGAIGNPVFPTNAQVAGFATFPGFPASLQAVLQSPQISALTAQMFPFYNGLKNNYFGNSSVSRTGYKEEDLVDYNSLNVKFNAGLYYKITNNLEVSWNSYFGTGTTVYTGADRYSLKNFKVGQHKLEFKSKTWMARGYTTQENAGDSYIAGALGAFINETARPSSVWFPTYIGTFSETKRLSMAAIDDHTLHNNMRLLMDTSTAYAGFPRFAPGSPQFNAAANQIKTTPVNKPGGAKFLDKSSLWAADFQVNVSDAAHFSNVVEMMVGGGWKQWVLKSQGTIFADTAGNILVNEYGGFLQLKKRLFNDILTLTGAIRYDKQTNYDGRWTPRITAVTRIAKENFVRLSFQTAYRFPTNQNQYINLRLGGGSSYLIGSLPEFQTLYKLNSTLPGYTAASVIAYRGGTIADSSRLVQAVFKPLVSETVNSYEIGYKGIIAKKLLVDAYFYASKYKNFILSTAVVQSNNGYKYELYSPFSTSLSYNQNSPDIVKSHGWGVGLEYEVFKKYFLYGNVFSDDLRNVPVGQVTFFNAPHYRWNLGLRNDNVWKNIGFNIVAKWQDNNYYEGTFVTGTLPSFTWVDAQVSYRMPKTKSIFRIGGTNISNSYHRTGFGSPYVGGLYYVSYGYNLY
jgi:outer membrane receptor protein involved in Fe transport